MLKKALIVIVVAVAGILAFAATKPDTFVVQRATTIKAPPEKIFPLIDDYRNWAAWSPWEKLDPAMKRTFSGSASGVTWTMRGPSPFMSKLMQVFASMDSMVGKDFESGLANLKAAAEK